LYELAQYAFLADRNGGQGLTFDKLLEPGCGMLQVWFYLVIEWILFPVLAYYIEQVTGAGTGVKKHPLFFLGVRQTDGRRWLGARASHKDGSKAAAEGSELEKKKRRWRWWRKPAAPAAGTSTAAEQTVPTGVGQVVGGGGEDEGQVASPLDYYYGSFACAAGSSQLSNAATGLGAQAEPAAAATPAEGGHLVAARQPPPATRKPTTSVRLSMAPGDADGAEGEEPEEGADVAAERARVEGMWGRWADAGQLPPAAMVLRQLRKVYPSRDGNAAKAAVHDLSLAIERCECFGLLGPNGAGKTTTLRMMEGFLEPSSGDAVVEGYSVLDDMDTIYSLMGACPQHDLLWEGLTGREHLLFYGRLKNLAGGELARAVDDGLRSVNLLPVGGDLVGSYSGGMKRRLSVAISLMGDPLVVYLDEPSTGLDPSSRRLLWEVIKKARRDKAVVLTTHSMEEAEALCDRLGIFVGGRLQCVGNPKDLTARYGGYLSFTITTPPHQEAAALKVVRSMSPSARLVYSLGGTQKLELPLGEVEVDAVFRRMEEVKLRGELELLDWGLSNATLEEVFMKLCRDKGVQMTAFA
jgi:ABC-type multidrug transport system ATPase subunit